MNRFFTLRTLFHDLRHLALLLIVGLVIACSSWGSDDPQPNATNANFEGSYKGKMVRTTKTGNQTFTQTTEKLTVVIKPGASAGTLTVQFFEEPFGEITDPLKATVKGNALTIVKQTTPGYPDDVYEGSGTLSGKTLALTLNNTYNGSTQVQTVTATKP